MRRLIAAAPVTSALLSLVVQTHPAGDRVLTHREQAPLIRLGVVRRFETDPVFRVFRPNTWPSIELNVTHAGQTSFTLIR